MANVAQGYNSLGNSYLGLGSGYAGVGSGYLNQGQGYAGLSNNALSQQAGALSTNQQNYNMLMAPYQQGLQAASDYGSYATGTAQSVNAGLTGIGQAGAAGAVGSANANAQGLSNIGGAVSGLGGNLQQNLLLNKLIGAQNPYGTDSQGNPYTVGDGSDDLYTSDASDYAGMGG
jgi:hypothetical protein